MLFHAVFRKAHIARHVCLYQVGAFYSYMYVEIYVNGNLYLPNFPAVATFWCSSNVRSGNRKA